MKCKILCADLRLHIIEIFRHNATKASGQKGQHLPENRYAQVGSLLLVFGQMPDDTPFIHAFFLSFMPCEMSVKLYLYLGLMHSLTSETNTQKIEIYCMK